MSKGLEAAFLKAKTAQKRGELAAAEHIYAAILKDFPKNVRAQKGMTALRQGMTGPVSDTEVATLPEAEWDAMVRLFNAGKSEELIAKGERLAELFPLSFRLLEILGTSNGTIGRFDAAAGWYRRALRVKPDFVAAYVNLAVTLERLGAKGDDGGQYAVEAIACYRRALEIAPDYPQAHFNLGALLQPLGRLDEAVAAYRRALQLEPDNADAQYNLAAALNGLGHAEEAIGHYRQAVELRPDFFEARHNLAITLKDLDRLDEAIASYERALVLRPDHAAAHSQKLFQQASICDWDALAADRAAVEMLGVSGRAALPFPMLALYDDPARHRIIAERHAAEEYGGMIALSFDRRPTPPDLIRIGYFSSDFQNHATMYLAARLFELHDRSRFAVHAFSYGRDQDDAMRQRLRGAVHMFHDVRALSDKAVTDLARLQGIDIAIDLKGYTRDGRLGIFAHRAAPVQISYLGYPGTLGAPFIDYVVADRTVIPDAQRRNFSEKILYLPDSYQVNDDSRAISDRPMTRAELGLPEKGFVFCCFNNSYKISPAEFDIWMRLLHRVEGSVIWLLRGNRWAEANLRREAEKRGIHPGRLVFAGRMPLADHLARHVQADLFLDTFNVNAHTTASDALWAGLPVITKPGQGFVARVAASLLTAVGVPELIAGTLEDYERLALELASDPVRLAEIRTRLAANRATAPLFDTARFTRSIEAGYERAHWAYVSGQAPADIVIEAGI